MSATARITERAGLAVAILPVVFMVVQWVAAIAHAADFGAPLAFEKPIYDDVFSASTLWLGWAAELTMLLALPTIAVSLLLAGATALFATGRAALLQLKVLGLGVFAWLASHLVPVFGGYFEWVMD